MPVWLLLLLLKSHDGCFGTHHSVNELVVYGLLHKETAGSDAVLALVEKHRAHAL